MCARQNKVKGDSKKMNCNWFFMSPKSTEHGREPFNKVITPFIYNNLIGILD